MKYIRIICVVLCVLLCLPGKFAFADGIAMTIHCELEKGTVRIAVEKATPSEFVTLEVTDTSGRVSYFDVKKSDVDGKVVFEYLNSQPGGTYHASVVCLEQSGVTDFSFLSLSELEQIFTTINQGVVEKNAVAVEKVISDNFDGLLLDRTSYSRVKESSSVFRQWVAKSGEVNTLKQLQNRFYEAVIETLILEQPKATTIESLLEDPFCVAVFDFETVMPKNQKGELVFYAMKGEVKKSVVEKAIAVTPLTVQNLSTHIVLYSLTEGLAKSKQWKDVEPLMFAYAKHGNLNLDTSAYQQLKDPSAVAKAMMGKSYSTYFDVETLFSSSVKNQQKKEGKNETSDGSDSTPGSGSVASVKDPPPIVQEQPSVNQSERIFTDMYDVQWAEAAVNHLYKQGIVNGVSKDLFEPNRAISRYETAKLLASVVKEHAVAHDTLFTDVTQGHWCYTYVQQAYADGLIMGNGDGTFGGDGFTTREEMAVMIHRAMKSMTPPVSEAVDAKLTDEDQFSPWAYSAVTELQKYGIVSGDENSCFHPQGKITRAEAAQMLYNLLKATDNLELKAEPPKIQERNIGAETSVHTEEISDPNVDKIVGLGLMKKKDGTKFYPNDIVTRGEFADILADLLNYKNKVKLTPTKQIYEDVPLWSAYAASIEYLASQGIFMGDDEGTFHSENPVNRRTVCETLTKILGYVYDGKVDAYTKGIQLGLIDGLPQEGDTLNRGQMACVLSHLLDTKMLLVESYSDSGSTSVIGGSFARERLGLEVGSGVVTTTPRRSIREDKGVGNGKIKIDQVEYAYTGVATEELLGYAVEFYYQPEKENVPCPIAYIGKEKVNKAMSLFVYDIVTYESLQYQYYVEGKPKKANIKTGADILYNGRLVEQDVNYVPEYGMVELIDNDSDGTFDVVMIMDYKILFVDNINDKSIYTHKADDRDKLINFEVSDAENLMLFRPDGAMGELSDIRAGSIILAAESVSKDMLQIELAEQKVTGMVGRINQSEKPLTIQLNESEYKVVGNILSKPAVMLGKTVTAYLDMYGNVVYLETGIQQEAQWNYGYVVKSSLNNDGYSLKIFDQSGDMVIRESQDSIMIDGVKTKYKNMPPIEKQLIRYRTDGETLKGIDTFCDRPTGDLQADPTEISDSFYRRGQGRYFYKKNLRIFRTISSGTVKGEILHSIAPVVFNIPEDALDETDYSVGTIEQFGGDKYYTLEGYNCDAESPLCDVIVIQDSRTGDYEGANMMLVKQAGSLLKADGTVGASLTCIYNGGEYTFAVKEDSSLLIDETYKITAGDVIVATKDGNDELIDIKLVYTESSDYGEINESKTYLGPSGDIGFNSPNRIDYCYLTKRLPDGYFILQNTDNKNLPLIYANNGCSVGVYDRDERRGDNKIRPGNFEDIYGMHVDGNERLLVQTSNSALKSIVILR